MSEYDPEKSREYLSKKRSEANVKKVLAFPVMREIPKSKYEFNQDGLDTFNHWTRKLADAGLLTEISFGQIENLALVDHSIAFALSVGKPPSLAQINARRTLLLWLESLNVEQSVISGETKRGIFSTNGFPNRLREPAEHKAQLAG